MRPAKITPAIGRILIEGFVCAAAKPKAVASGSKSVARSSGNSPKPYTVKPTMVRAKNKPRSCLSVWIKPRTSRVIKSTAPAIPVSLSIHNKSLWGRRIDVCPLITLSLVPFSPVPGYSIFHWPPPTPVTG